MANDAVVQPLSKVPSDTLAYALRLLTEAGVKVSDLQKTIDDKQFRNMVALALMNHRVGLAFIAQFLEREVTIRFFVGIYGMDRVYGEGDIGRAVSVSKPLRRLIELLLEELDDRQRRAIIYMYGLNGLPPLDRQELATVIGLPQEDLAILILDAKTAIQSRDLATLL